MKLGKHSQITIGTKDVHQSYEVYQKLGFRKVGESNTPYPWIQITDNSTLILLSADGMEYLGLTYFEKGMTEKVAEMEKKGISFVRKTEQIGFFQGIFATPDNFYISLIDYEEEAKTKEKRHTLLDIPQDKWAEIKDYPNEKIGIFGELCMPVKDLNSSIAFWQKLGFEAQTFEGPYPWAILHDEMNIIGLHQTTEFSTPALTYFCKEMGDKIKALKAEGLRGFEIFGGTGGNESNQVLKTPENQRFFLFSF